MRHLHVLFLLLIACHPSPPPHSVPAAAPAPAGTRPPAAAPAVDSMTAQAAYDAKDWSSCATQFVQVAERDAWRAAGDFYNAACCYARAGQAEPAFATLQRAIAAGYYDRGQAAADEDLATLHADPRWATTLDDMTRAEAAWEKSLGDPALRKELLAMRDQDQAARKAMIQGKGDPSLDAKVIEIDRKDTARMKEIVAKLGMPAPSRRL